MNPRRTATDAHLPRRSGHSRSQKNKTRVRQLNRTARVVPAESPPTGRSPVAPVQNYKLIGWIPAPASGQAQQPPALRLFRGGRRQRQQRIEFYRSSGSPLSSAIERGTHHLTCRSRSPALALLHCRSRSVQGGVAAPARISRKDRTCRRGLGERKFPRPAVNSCKVCRRHGIRVRSPRQHQHPNAGTTGRPVVRARPRTVRPVRGPA